MPFQPEPGTFYTVEDLAESGIGSIITIRRWIKAGRLKASLVGRGYMIEGEDLRDFLLAGTGAPPAKKAKVKAAGK